MDAAASLAADHVEHRVRVDDAGVGDAVRDQDDSLNDALLERLADRGNGQGLHVDRLEEARKAFVDGLAGTLDSIARDVKIQVDLDPAKVLRYRRLGYKNRAQVEEIRRQNDDLRRRLEELLQR